MGYSMVNVLKTNSNAGRPVSFKDRIILFRWDDVDTVPERDASGVLYPALIEGEANDLVMKTGKTAIEMYVTPKTLKVYDTSEGDPDKKGFIQHLEFEHPGDELEYAEFAENAINENFGAIIQTCDGSRSRLLGTPCCPIQFSHEGQNDSDAVTNMVKFESLLRGPKIGHYDGDLPDIYEPES
jgi:hypothetical protein